MTFAGSREVTISQLWALAYECASAGWDSEGARPVSPFAANRAASFIRSLPDVFPLPDLAAEPDGALSLDWIQSRTRLFSVSIGLSENLPFAWIDGTDSGHAVAHFDGRRIPARILNGIRETMLTAG